MATSIDLYEGPGVEVIGINDVESLSLELRDYIAHATTDSQKRLKVRDVQTHVFTRSNSQVTTPTRDDLLGDKREREKMASEVQTQIGIISKASAVQAVAAMEVVNIPSKGQKRRVVEGATTSFCLLPDKEVRNIDQIRREPPTSDVMTQISCLLHSRGIHSDLESYLSDYKKRFSINTETSDLCTQIRSVERDHAANIDGPNSKHYVNSFVKEKVEEGEAIDRETYITNVVRNASTQVSSRLVPTEVTMSKINMKNMKVCFTSPLREVDIGLPMDSIICPADMKFKPELCEGSDFGIVDYSGLSDILITHDGSVARGSINFNEVPPQSRDLQTQITSGLKAQAAIVLRTEEAKKGLGDVNIGEVIANSKSVKLVVRDAVGHEIHARRNPSLNLRTQICDSARPTDAGYMPVELTENAVDFAKRWSVVEGDYTTLREPRTCTQDHQSGVTDARDESVRVIGEIVCSKCHLRYREIQMQFDPATKVRKGNRDSIQTQVCSLLSDSGTQSTVKRRMYDEQIIKQGNPQTNDACMQVSVKLIPSEISVSRYDVETLELEFEEEGAEDSYRAQIKSVTCPAKMKMNTHLVEGSGVCIADLDETENIKLNIYSEAKNRTEGSTSTVHNPDKDRDSNAYVEFRSTISLEHPVRRASLSQERRNPVKSTERSLVRLVPCGMGGIKTNSSDTITQIFSIMADASVQVGTQLVPQAIGISPIHLNNMEIAVKEKEGVNCEETLSTSTLLYPAQVELTSRLVNEQSGIEIVPLEQVEIMHMDSPNIGSLIKYHSSQIRSLDVQTQIETQMLEHERPNLLPASIMLETGQFDGRRRTPEFVSQSLISSVLSNSHRHQGLTIRAKSSSKTISDLACEQSVSLLGHVTKETSTQTNTTKSLPTGEEIYLTIPKIRSISVQVGAKLVPKALKVSQIPIKNLILESISSSSGEKRRLSFESLRCPTELTVKTELCEDSGIVIGSLDKSGEIEVGLSAETMSSSETRQIANRDQSNKRNMMSGWWSSIMNGRAPLFDIKSTQNAAVKVPCVGVQDTTSKLLLNEGNISLQAEAVLLPVKGNFCGQINLDSSSNENPQLKLVVVETSPQQKSKFATDLSCKSNLIDHGVQVGVKLIPNSIEVKPIRVENMEAVLINKKSRISNGIDVSAILYSSGIHYSEELAEASGVHVIQIDNEEDISLNYCGNRFDASSNSFERKEPLIGKFSGDRSVGIYGNVSNISLRQLQSSAFENGLVMNEDGEYVATLKIKNAQYLGGKEPSRVCCQDAPNLDKAVNNVNYHTETFDKDVQVGLNLVPKTFIVDPMKVNNLDLMKEKRDRYVTEQVSVGARLCTRLTQYEEILTDSGGVTVLPIEAGENIQIAHSGMMYDTAVDSRRDNLQESCNSSHIECADKTILPRLRVCHVEFPVAGKCLADSFVSSRPKAKVDGTTQVGAVLVPTELSMEHMILDTRCIPSLSRMFGTGTVLCPANMSASSVLTECSGITIVPTGGVSEISIKTDQGLFEAEVLQDSQSTQACLTIKEISIKSPKQLTGNAFSIIQPTVSTGFMQRSYSSTRSPSATNNSISSKSVQVGALLIPTAVTVEKVMVDNLEVEVPLHPLRKAEISVSAVLASSMTEVTSVLTNTSGIHVIPLSQVDEIGVQVNKQNFVGTVGNSQLSRGFVRSNTSSNPPTQKLVLPISPSATAAATSTYAEDLLLQSTDLNQLRESLRSSQIELHLRELNSASLSLSGRPGLLRMSEPSIAPITERKEINPKAGVRETQNCAVQVGLKLIPQAIEVFRKKPSETETDMTSDDMLTSEETILHSLLNSSTVQYGEMLAESTGVNVLPIKNIRNISVKHADNERNLEQTDTSVEPILKSSSTKSNIVSEDTSDVRFSNGEYFRNRRNGGCYTSISTRPTEHTHAATQVGAAVVFQQLNLQKMLLETEKSNGKLESVLYPLNMEAAIKLCDASGVQVEHFDGNLSICIDNMDYHADIVKTSTGNDASIRLVSKDITLHNNNRSVIEVSLNKPLGDGYDTRVSERRESYFGSVKTRLVSSSSQVGTLLVPTKISMDKIDVENLAVEVPLTEWKTTDLTVSAILASTATELTPVITDTTGIQVVRMKDLDELGIQVGDDVYVANILSPKSNFMAGAFSDAKNFSVDANCTNRKREVIFVSVPKIHKTTQLTQKAETLLNESANLRDVHSRLQSSSTQLRLHLDSTSGASMRMTRSLNPQQLENRMLTGSSVFSCQYAAANLEGHLIDITCNSCGANGTVAIGNTQESYHVICEAAIKPTMISKRLTANIRPLSIDVGTYFSGAVTEPSSETIIVLETNADQKPEYIPGASVALERSMKQRGTQCATLHRNVLGFTAQGKFIEENYGTNLTLFPQSTPQFAHEQEKFYDTTLEQTKHTYSAESHSQRLGSICAHCGNKMSLTENNITGLHDTNEFQAAITIRRRSDEDLFGTSQSVTSNSQSELRHNFSSRDAAKSLSGSLQSLKSQPMASKRTTCLAEMTSADITTSIRSSTSSLLGSEAVVNVSVKEIADAYTGICRSTGESDNTMVGEEHTSLYQTLKYNPIIQSVIKDYEKVKNADEGIFSTEVKEIVDILLAKEKQIGVVTSEPTAYSLIENNAVAKRIVKSYEAYRHSQNTDVGTQADFTQILGQVYSSSDVQEISDVVNTLGQSQKGISSQISLYMELKSNPIIQQVIRDYELIEKTQTMPRTVGEATVKSSRPQSTRILSLDGHLARMESEQFISTDSMTQGSFQIIKRKRNHSSDKPISSSVSSDSEVENAIREMRASQSLMEPTRYDVACSALITPETWDKKVQIESVKL